MSLLSWRMHEGNKMSERSIAELIDDYHQSVIADPFNEANWLVVASQLKQQVVAKSRDDAAYLAWLGRNSIALFTHRIQTPSSVELMKLLQALQELEWLEQAKARAQGERRRG